MGEDIGAACAACRRLQEQIGEEVILSELCLKDERSTDVLVLKDPSGENVFMINQAPKGYARIAREAGMLKPMVCKHGSPLVALMDVQLSVPSGTSSRIANFYRRFLSASGRRTE